MAKSKIEWTDFTWNPVWGCNAGCDYCYARNIAKRFAYQITKNELNAKGIRGVIDRELTGEDIEEQLKSFKPIFLNSTFHNFKFPKKPSRIFIGSMSDIAFWKDDWLEKVVEKIKQFPQHTFLLLTKFPKVYKKLDKFMPDNVLFGITVTNQIEMSKLRILQAIKQGKRKIYVSFEPLLDNIKNEFLLRTKDNKYPFRKLEHKYRTTLLDNLDWLIIGAMSGNNKPRTKTEWIESLVKMAKDYDVPVFVKQIEINGKIEKEISKFPKELQYREFPIALIEESESPNL